MSELLNVMIVPFQQKRAVVLPREVVGYVLPYAPPLPSSYSQAALVGSLIYQSEKVPVLDMSVLFNQQPTALSEIDGKRRIVIISCLHKHPDFNSYALLASEAPRMIQLQESDVHDIDSELPDLFYSHIDLAEDKMDHMLYVPDLKALEATLFD